MSALQQANPGRSLDLDAGVKQKLDDLVKHTRDVLSQETLTKYDYSRLPGVERSLKQMAEEARQLPEEGTTDQKDAPEGKTVVAPDGELRDVLAAAWRLRLLDSPSQADVIAKEAKLLWNLMRETNRASAAPYSGWIASKP
jgi:hypothetical protein